MPKNKSSKGYGKPQKTRLMADFLAISSKTAFFCRLKSGKSQVNVI